MIVNSSAAALFGLPFLQKLQQERRRHQRVKVSIMGRYMLADRREFPCQTLDMSPGGVALIAPVKANVNERVIVYLDHLGRLAGRVARHIENGFAIELANTVAKRENLAEQLTWLANRHALRMPEDRRHERITPRITRNTVTMPDGSVISVKIIDISLSGAAVQSPTKVTIGANVILGQTPGKIVRLLEGGFAVEFNRQIPESGFNDLVRL